MKYKTEDIGEVLSLIVQAQSKLWQMADDAYPVNSPADTSYCLDFFAGLTEQVEKGDLSGAAQKISDEGNRLNLGEFMNQLNDPQHAMMSKLIYDTYKAIESFKTRDGSGMPSQED